MAVHSVGDKRFYMISSMFWSTYLFGSELHLFRVRFEVFTAVTVKKAVFRDVAPYPRRLLSSYICFFYHAGLLLSSSSGHQRQHLSNQVSLIYRLGSVKRTFLQGKSGFLWWVLIASLLTIQPNCSNTIRQQQTLMLTHQWMLTYLSHKSKHNWTAHTVSSGMCSISFWGVITMTYSISNRIWKPVPNTSSLLEYGWHKFFPCGGQGGQNMKLCSRT
jgi:hypothetical protein